MFNGIYRNYYIIKFEMGGEIVEINTQEKIKRAMKKAKVSQKDIAEHFGVTSGAFSQRLKTGKFNEDELKTIAELLGAKYFSGFEFPDGEKIF